MSNTTRIENFVKTKSRRPRAFVLGNIANNGYLNAQVLEQAGFDVLVWGGDDPYLMSHPTWELDEYSVSKGSNHFAIDYLSLDVEPARIPWFFSGSMDLATQYFVAIFRGNFDEAYKIFCTSVIMLMERPNQLDWSAYVADQLYCGEEKRNDFFEYCRDTYSRYFSGRDASEGIHKLIDKFKAPQSGWCGTRFSHDWTEIYIDRSYPDLEFWKSKFNDRYPPIEFQLNFTSAEQIYNQSQFGQLSQDELNIWSGFPDRWREIFENVDCIIATSIYGAIPMLNGVANYTCYEHGTIRDLPFLGDGQGRMLLLTYSEAAHIFSTNADVYDQALYLSENKAEKITRLPHAFDNGAQVDIIKKKDSFFSEVMKKFTREKAISVSTTGQKYQILAPARHDWAIKGTQIILEAAKLISKDEIQFEFVFVSWGNEVERSKAFLEENEIEDCVSWVELCSKPGLRKLMAQSFVVLDQFNHSAFGTLTLEALGLGVPVITRINEESMKSFFGQSPPVLNASTPEQIVNNIRELKMKQEFKEEISASSMEWMKNFHSVGRFQELQIPVLMKLLES